jgi:hypothetical protein
MDHYLHTYTHHHPYQKNVILSTLISKVHNVFDSNHLGKETPYLSMTFFDNGYNPKQIQKVLQMVWLPSS